MAHLRITLHQGILTARFLLGRDPQVSWPWGQSVATNTYCKNPSPLDPIACRKQDAGRINTTRMRWKFSTRHLTTIAGLTACSFLVMRMARTFVQTNFMQCIFCSHCTSNWDRQKDVPVGRRETPSSP